MGLTDPGKPWDYWNNTAATKPEARALAERLGLNFPTDNEGRGTHSGLVYPIRRLIITGEDSPDNFALLLGPQWESLRTSGYSDMIEQTRIDVLLCPPPNSPSGVMAGYYDKGAPRWAPRGPNAEEEATINEIKKMSRRMSEINDEEGTSA